MIYIDLIKYDIEDGAYVDDSARSVSPKSCINVPTSTNIGENLLLFLTSHNCFEEKKMKEVAGCTDIVNDGLLTIKVNSEILNAIEKEKERSRIRLREKFSLDCMI